MKEMDLENEIADLKDIIGNLQVVMECGFQYLSLTGNEKELKEYALGFIGISAYVTGHVNEKLSTVLEELGT